MFVWVVAIGPFASATDGTFQGRLVDLPERAKSDQGWVFVQGRNHLVRRVDVSHAVIVFATQASSKPEKKCDRECLAVGQEVRVTAEQDGSGEWRAKRVEILDDGPPKTETGQVHTAFASRNIQSLRNLIPLKAGLLDNRLCAVVHPIPYGEIHHYLKWSGGIMKDVL